MSCLYQHATTRIASIVGLPNETIDAVMEAAKSNRANLPSFTINPTVARAFATHTIGTQDTDHAETVLQHVARGLYYLRSQMRAGHPRIMRVTALLHALVQQPPPDDPSTHETLRNRLLQDLLDQPEPQPLGPMLHDMLDLDRIEDMEYLEPLRRAVYRASLFDTTLTFDEVRMMIGLPSLRSGLGFALAYNMEPSADLWHWSEQLPEAAAAALSEGITYPALLQSAFQQRWTAWYVFQTRPDLRHEAANVILQLGPSEMIAKLVSQMPSLLENPAVRQSLVSSPEAAAAAFKFLPQLRACDDVITMIAQSPYCATICEQYPEFRSHPIVRHTVLTGPLRKTVTAVCAYPDAYSDNELFQIVRESPENAYTVASTFPELADHPAIIATLADDPVMAARAMTTIPQLHDHPILMRAVRSDADALSLIVTHRPSLLDDPNVRKTLAWKPLVSARTMVAYPELRTDPQFIAAASRDANSAAMVLEQCPDVAAPTLIAAAATYPQTAWKVFKARPDLQTNPKLITRLLQERHMCQGILDVCGPAPAIWSLVGKEHQDEFIRRYRMTEQEEQWLKNLLKRWRNGDRGWTPEDEQRAQRFAWRERFRDACTTAT